MFSLIIEIRLVVRACIVYVYGSLKNTVEVSEIGRRRTIDGRRQGVFFYEKYFITGFFKEPKFIFKSLLP